ncbi:MAG: amidohydrolase family protein [Candidatus Daviesbacteria bacterium]|nr:amidohydrolase family protein [Candidatus Daviesbacteria bacterium]
MGQIISLPGLIDIHTHLRTPGQENKEDFLTGTSAALAGGFTTILDMPNNKIPITTQVLLAEKIELARQSSVCDIGFHFGSLGDNLEEFEKVTAGHPERSEGSLVFGLKLYLNPTTGNFLIDRAKLKSIYQSWPGNQPILLHCEGETMPMALKVIKETGKKTHICHVSSKEELSAIIEAKKAGLPITCGATPHHLFLTEEDAKTLGAYGHMKPFLKTQADVDFLWQNLENIDIIESDHAPHTKEEKDSDNPPFGVPGLETTLPLLLTAVSEGKLKLEDIERLCHKNPARIFNIPTSPDTKVLVDLDEEYEIKNQQAVSFGNENLKTKCGWSPFNGKKVKGKVKQVYLRGEKVFENGKILAKEGSGKVIYPT